MLEPDRTKHKLLFFFFLGTVRGWFNLYDSKLVNAGIRLTQTRIKDDNNIWIVDNGDYNKGWTNISEVENSTIHSAWKYTTVSAIKYFGLCTYQVNIILTIV